MFRRTFQDTVGVRFLQEDSFMHQSFLHPSIHPSIRPSVHPGYCSDTVLGMRAVDIYEVFTAWSVVPALLQLGTLGGLSHWRP